MTSDRLPPDPWADEGVDLWTLEKAERLAAEDPDSADPRWDDLDGPSIDEFYDAESEMAESDDVHGSGLIGALRPWLGLIALLVAVAMVLTYAIR